MGSLWRRHLRMSSIGVSPPHLSLRRVKQENQTTDNYPLAVENLPDVKGYATSDLWVKHPTKNLWKM